MKTIHIPSLGTRYWTALCIASVFGANMGDFFAGNLGLGHLAGLPFLAVALTMVLMAERWDQLRREVYYWLAIIIVRTAATNFADFTSIDLGLRRIWVVPALVVFLAGAAWSTWRFAWRRTGEAAEVLPADVGYWVCMFLAGALGTEIGDQCSHYLGAGTASVLLSPIVASLFMMGSGRLRFLPLYWTTVVMIRTAGTSIGDFLASRHMLGLPLSTAVTGAIFVVLLLTWKEQLRSDQANGVGLRHNEQTRV
jgi:uncharacterized membrane-anchored protein